MTLGEEYAHARKAYDSLSEFAHPNWAGMLGFFGSTNKRSMIQYMKSPSRNRIDVHQQVINGAGAILLFGPVLDRMEKSFKEIVKICQEKTSDAGHS
jgi:hypothetical protein